MLEVFVFFAETIFFFNKRHIITIIKKDARCSFRYEAAAAVMTTLSTEVISLYVIAAIVPTVQTLLQNTVSSLCSNKGAGYCVISLKKKKKKDFQTAWFHLPLGMTQIKPAHSFIIFRLQEWKACYAATRNPEPYQQRCLCLCSASVTRCWKSDRFPTVCVQVHMPESVMAPWYTVGVKQNVKQPSLARDWIPEAAGWELTSHLFLWTMERCKSRVWSDLLA